MNHKSIGSKWTPDSDLATKYMFDLSVRTSATSLPLERCRADCIVEG